MTKMIRRLLVVPLLRFAALGTACLPIAACSVTVGSAPGAPHSVPSDEGYVAGVAEADITPPLHLSLFGHGPESRIAAGFRLRLGCEIFVIATRNDIVALVPCDLQSPSLTLQRGVAARLKTAGIPIGADQLFIMATHTHAGPAHYFEARRYSGTFSSEAPGYDQRVVDFLAERIAGGIAEAFTRLAPACIGWGQTEIFGLTFNRSYVPFLANDRSAAGTREADDPRARADLAEENARTAQWRTEKSDDERGPKQLVRSGERAILTGPEQAIDPRLTVLALYRRSGEPSSCADSSLEGVLAIYGMHPTGVPNTNDLYHGDIFGFAVRTAEGRLSPHASLDTPLGQRELESADANAPHVIVGLANGVEGDVSPKLDFQSVPEARKHGRTLGEAIVSLTEKITHRSGQGPLTHLSWDLEFPSGQYDGEQEHQLCPHAELGMAAAGGARDGPTRVRIVPAANAGFQPDRPSDCHLQKVPLRSGVGQSPDDFPQVGPIGLIQVDDGLLATVPGEVTTMTGERIRLAIEGRTSADRHRLAIAALTNQYFQYFATHEEYAFQYYEGASTLYGPHSEQFLVRHFGCLASQLVGAVNECQGRYMINRPASLEFRPAPRVQRWPDEEDVEPPALAPLQVCKRQREGALGWELEIGALPLTFSSDRGQFSVSVLSGATGEDSLDDDRGASIEVREIGDDKWRVRWVPDLVKDDPRCGRQYRLAVRGVVNLTSHAFTLACNATSEQCAQ